MFFLRELVLSITLQRTSALAYKGKANHHDHIYVQSYTTSFVEESKEAAVQQNSLVQIAVKENKM